MQLLQHVEIVVAGGAVGAQRHVDTLCQQLRNRREPAAQLHVAGGIVDHADVLFPQQRPILCRHPHAVGGGAGHVEHSQIVHPRRRGLAVFLDAGIMLAFRLAEVDVHSHAVLAAPRRRSRRHVGIAGVLRVKAAVHPNASLGGVVPVLIESFQLPGTFILLVGLRRVEGLHRIAEVGLDAAHRHQLRRLPREEVHVGKAGGAAGQHLQQRQRRTGSDILRRHAALHGEYAVKQPPLQRQVSPHAPQQRHSGVGVGVHQSRQQQLAGHVLFAVEAALRALRAHRDDRRLIDHHIAALDHALRRVDPRVFQ